MTRQTCHAKASVLEQGSMLDESASHMLHDQMQLMQHDCFIEASRHSKTCEMTQCDPVMYRQQLLPGRTGSGKIDAGGAQSHRYRC